MSGGVNLDLYIDKLFKCELLAEPVIKSLCNKLKEQLINESNVQHVKAPVTVVGDVHGYATEEYRVKHFLS